MKHLKLEQRYAISAYLKSGKTKTFIASQLKVNECTIRREIKRNSTKRGKYNPDFAQELADERKERFAINRKFDINMEQYIDKQLREEQWSPEQIKGVCDKEGRPMVCMERIYQYIRKDKALKGTLYQHLRHKLKHRSRPVSGKHQVIKDRVSIDQRPPEVDSKECFGHWEMDLIVGKENKGAILTLVERKTGFFMMEKLAKGKNAKALAQTVVKLLLPYKKNVLSITTDNGSEFAEHKTITKRLEAQVYFAHPYCSWEKGLIEYTNKLIRQYIPKKQTFDKYNELQIKNIQYKINRRPRKNLNFKSPKDLFFNFVA